MKGQPCVGNPSGPGFAQTLTLGAFMSMALPCTLGLTSAAVQSLHPKRRLWADQDPITLRRFCGPLADELYLVCRPRELAADVAIQTESLYQALLDVLSSEGVGPDSLVTETVFFRKIEDDFRIVRDARRRVIERTGLASRGPATTFIGESPLGDEARVVVAAVAVAPHRSQTPSTFELTRRLRCPCEACSEGSHAMAIRLGDQTHVHTGNVFGQGGSAFDETFDMFCQAEALLGEAGMTFRDVIRTWIHLRDIDRDYHALNRARREFFGRRGIDRRPASTAVQGIPFGDVHDFSMSFFAVKSPRPLEAPRMSTPMLNEPWTYGADFSRGLRLVDANKTALHVSGTASIDENGKSVHLGDFERQAERMLRNIATLLEEQGASFDDLVSAVTYLKRPGDAQALHEIFRDRGFDGFPCAIVEAPLCRPELLCETEAVAILPLPGGA